MPNLDTPLVAHRRRVDKPRTFFGYLPLWQECFPLTDNGKVDTVRVVAEVMAGCIIGIRQTLSAIVSATLVYTSTGNGTLVGMFPFGISMMWYSTMMGSVFYGIFGRLQYNTNATQEVCAIFYGVMASRAAVRLADEPGRIPPTVLALIVTGTVFTGVCCFLFGKLGIGKLMLAFPSPVTTGFLGTIGFFLVKQALQITSGVTFQYFYPISLIDFFAPRSLCPICCLIAMTMFMRRGPGLLKMCFPRSKFVAKLGRLICQLLPLFVFHLVLVLAGTGLDVAGEAGWVYPAQSAGSFTSLWTTYSLRDADWGVVVGSLPEMFSLVFMSALCTMTGVLGITDKFASGPDGDPAPDDVVDFDAELTTVGMGAIVTGLTNGVVTFHRLGSSVQLRSDGGEHRVAVMSSAAFVGVFFFSSIPLGHYIPKFFLGGLFLDTGVVFLECVFRLHHVLPPSGVRCLGRQVPSSEYYVAIVCVLVAAFTSPFAGIASGLALTLVAFLRQSAATPPVSSKSDGAQTMSRTLRPVWELEVLRQVGKRVVLLYLQGPLFFGSGQALANLIVETVEENNAVRFCVLSFAKVSSIDYSAIKQLKSVMEKAKRRSCTLIFCRMSEGVYTALCAADIIRAPDKDLRMLLEIREEPYTVCEEPAQQSDTQQQQQGDAEELCSVGIAPPKSMSLRRVASFKPIGSGAYDAFDHETDALDYCSDRLLGEECYGQGSELEDYRRRYRTSCETGARLDEWAFEKQHGLRAGVMQRLREKVQVLSGLSAGDILPGGRGRSSAALYFVFQGAVAMVDEETRMSQRMDAPKVATKGFRGRGGKRLRKRYPPGSVVGTSSFFLGCSGELIQSVFPELHVSSKFGQSAEVWVLDAEAWGSLEPDLQQILERVALRQLAAEKQHTLLSGE